MKWWTQINGKSAIIYFGASYNNISVDVKFIGVLEEIKNAHNIELAAERKKSADECFAILVKLAAEREKREAWEQRGKGMKLGNENYARENAELHKQLAAERQRREWAESRMESI